MALNFQTSTLSLTLPISCQICLGKVRQPVICANHHVFCSSCMEMWLKKATQCPTCRVPITADNPCREIIGGTNESDSPSTRKCLRKTRGELLLREYEEEIELLMRENEELKSRNQILESQLKTPLDPSKTNAFQTEDKPVDPLVLEELSNKLRTATDVCEKIKQDMDKLKEANKALRSQNVDLVQENMRLKAEVASRSPQKFGRYTVAALEAKIQQYERSMEHLKKALERSDQYIEDLESKLRKPENRCQEVQDVHLAGSAGANSLSQQQRISMMMRSLSDSERSSICSNPEGECQALARNPGLACAPPAIYKESQKRHSERSLEGASPDFLPTTPSSAFRSLTLRSPGVREKKVAFKSVSHLRKLNFDDFPSPEKTYSLAVEKPSCSADKLSKTDLESSKSVSWDVWSRAESSKPGPSGESAGAGTTSVLAGGESPSSLHTSSEASMDAAYLDKISELDSMMLDGESSSSRGSQLSLGSCPSEDLDSTVVPDPPGCPDDSSSLPQSDADHQDQRTAQEGTSAASSEEQGVPLGSDGNGGAAAPGFPSAGGSSQTEELSFDLLFQPLEESRCDPDGSLGKASHCNPRASPCASSSCLDKPTSAAKDRQAMISQPTKRKSHSPFNTSSPTKLSKLM